MNVQLETLNRLTTLVMPPDDQAAMMQFFQQADLDRQADDDQDWLTQDLINFFAAHALRFFWLFDWKEDSQAVLDYIHSTLRRNFGLEITIGTPWNPAKMPIDETYRYYDQQLSVFELRLCHIDIDSDSYQIMLVRDRDLAEAKTLVTLLGYALKDSNDEW